MIFTFDKRLATEKAISMDYYNEQVRNKKLNATKEYKIRSEEDFPDISGFEDNTSFVTLDVTDIDDHGQEIVVPIVGTYNNIDTFNVSYSSIGKTYLINMILGVKTQ